MSNFPDKPISLIAKLALNTRDLYAYVQDVAGFIYRRVKDQEAIDRLEDISAKLDRIEVDDHKGSTVVFGGTNGLSVTTLTKVAANVASVDDKIIKGS